MDIQFECERRYESLATCVSGRAAINNVLPPKKLVYSLCQFPTTGWWCCESNSHRGAVGM